MLLNSWYDFPENSDFSIYNLPYGIFSYGTKPPRVGVAVGNEILDLFRLEVAGFFDDIDFSTTNLFLGPNLNLFMEEGYEVWNKVRKRVTEILTSTTDLGVKLRDDDGLRIASFIPQDEATMYLPVEIGDYTDFYSSKEHATNVGIMFRGKDNALMPNWLHIPIAYHGRASSVVVSGTDLRRPMGQINNNNTIPKFESSGRVDFELEMAFLIGGKGNKLGDRIDIKDAEKHIFGMVVMNDWSARDIQRWEYQPLGPFGSKNMGTLISPWVVSMEALEPFRVAGPKQDPEPLPYLQLEGNNSFDINLELSIQTNEMEEPFVLSKTNHKYLYWNIFQQLTHHTVTGCNIKSGDLMASGTISGPTKDSYGSMLELAWKGDNPIELPSGEKRVFLKDGDRITITGYCEKEGRRVGFGEVTGKVLPAH